VVGGYYSADEVGHEIGLKCALDSTDTYYSYS